MDGELELAAFFSVSGDIVAKNLLNASAGILAIRMRIGRPPAISISRSPVGRLRTPRTCANFSRRSPRPSSITCGYIYLKIHIFICYLHTRARTHASTHTHTHTLTRFQRSLPLRLYPQSPQSPNRPHQPPRCLLRPRHPCRPSSPYLQPVSFRTPRSP